MTYKSKYLQYKLKYILAKNFSGGGGDSHQRSKTPETPKPSELQQPSKRPNTFDTFQEEPKTPKTPKKQEASETSEKQDEPKTPKLIRTDGPPPRQFRTPEAPNKPIELPEGLRTPGDKKPNSNIESSYESLPISDFELTTAEIPVQSTTSKKPQNNIELPQSWDISNQEEDIINKLEETVNEILKQRNKELILQKIDYANALLKQENLTKKGKSRLSIIISNLLKSSPDFIEADPDIINNLEETVNKILEEKDPEQKKKLIQKKIKYVNDLLKHEYLTEDGKFRLGKIAVNLQRISSDFIPEEIVEAGDVSEDQEEVSESKEVTPVAQEVPELDKETSDFIIYLYQKKGKRISKDIDKKTRNNQNEEIIKEIIDFIDFINENKDKKEYAGTLEIIENIYKELVNEQKELSQEIEGQSIKEQKELSEEIEGEYITLNINLGDKEYQINVDSSQPLHETVLASLKDKKVDVKEPLLIMYGEEELLDEEQGVPNTFSDYGLEDNARLSVQFNVDDRSSTSSSVPSILNNPPPHLNEEDEEVCKLASGKCIIQGGNKKKYGVYQDKLVEIIKKHNDHPKPYYTINIKGGERQVDSLVELN